jgi:CheY-like chemotaxis protein
MGQRLLIVDSDMAFLKEHQIALESAFDMEVCTSTDGVLARLEEGSFAAVLICVEVSENKGYALCSAIRKSHSLGHVKVALISAKATEEEYARHQSLKGRADIYLHKPIRPANLVESLSPLVPPRAVDPDNPLGDLIGADLGDEWIENLKVEVSQDNFPEAKVELASPLSESLSPLPEVVDVSPAAQTMMVPVSSINAPEVNAGKIELLEFRIQDLEGKLLTQAKSLEEKDQEIEVLRSTPSPVTLNMEDVERHQAESEVLQTRIKESEDAALSLKSELDELRSSLVTAEQDRDRLRNEMDDLESRSSTLSGVQSDLVEIQQVVDQLREELSLSKRDVAGLEGTLRGQGRELADQGLKINVLEKEKQELSSKLEQETARALALEQSLDSLDQAKEAYEQQISELESMVLRMESACQASEAELGTLRESYQDIETRSKSAREESDLRIKELETAQAASAKAIGKIDTELAEANQKCETLEAELASTQKSLSDSETTLAQVKPDLEEARALLGQTEKDLAEAREAEARVRALCAEVESRLTQANEEHRQQQLELLAGIDDRDAKLAELKESNETQGARISVLEAKLEARDTKIQSLSEALGDVLDRARQGLEAGETV